MPSMSTTTFPFDQYISHPLPNYEYEWNLIIVKLILVSIFFLVVVPIILNGDGSRTNSKDSTKIPNESTGITNNNNDNDSYDTSNSNHKSAIKKAKRKETKKHAILMLSNFLYLLIIFFFIATSPNNIDTSRHVYQAPLLTESECLMIIDMANKAAERNTMTAEMKLSNLEDNDQKKTLEKVLKWPSGWKKDRHGNYPTTDLNVVIDFTMEDLDYISKRLHARLSPLLETIYGISKDSIRANDMFVVRYDGEGQQALEEHTDSSHISFNILLNDDFEGGGTRYHNRVENTYYDVKPKIGDVLINNAMVTHEGLPTVKGEITSFLVSYYHKYHYELSSLHCNFLHPYIDIIDKFEFFFSLLLFKNFYYIRRNKVYLSWFHEH